MARFFGEVGYGDSIETSPGVWVDKITDKRNYFGDVIRNTRRAEPGENLNDDISVSNSISIVADDLAFEHFLKIKYVEWAGVLWTVTNVSVERPRLVLTLGEVYHGET
jgi:hypothetical protein